MNKKLTLTGANILFFVFTSVFIIYQIVLGEIIGNELKNNIYTIVLINEFVFILSPVIIYCLVKRINIKETFRFNKLGLVPMLLVAFISVPAYFVAAMLNNVLVYFLQFIGDIPAQPIPVPQNLSELAMGILIIAVVPGICEEIMHRGFLLKAYEKRGSYKAVVIVSIYFGIFHFDITNFFGPVFLGLVIGYYVIRTNSIFAGMLAHFLNNTIATILQYIYREIAIPEKMTITWVDLQKLLLIGFICLIITAGLLILFKIVTEGGCEISPPITTIGRDAKAILSHWPIILVLVIFFIMMLLNLLAMVMMKLMG